MTDSRVDAIRARLGPRPDYMRGNDDADIWWLLDQIAAKDAEIERLRTELGRRKDDEAEKTAKWWAARDAAYEAGER